MNQRESGGLQARRRWVLLSAALALAASLLGVGATAQARGVAPTERSAPTASVAAEPAAASLGCTTNCAIQSVATGMFVSTELSFRGDRNGVLRARATQPRGWEAFTIVGDCSTKRGCWIKSTANGKWLFPDWDSRVLRASLTEQGGNSLFRTSGDCTSAEGCLIRPVVPGLYLAADLTASGNDYGVLRSNDFWAPSAQRFRIVPVSAPLPAPVIGCAQACAIQSLSTGAFVSQTDGPGRNLAADSTTVGQRQSFSIVGDCGPKAACALRSDSNGRFVNVAAKDSSSSAAGVLGARSDTVRGWEAFGVIGDCTSSTGCVLQSRANRQFVVTTPADAGSVLRASSPTIAGADRFRVTPAALLAPTSIASTATYSCAINLGGTVSCWGTMALEGITAADTSPVPTTPVDGIVGATAIDAGINTACAVVAGGSVSCWGGPQYGSGDPTVALAYDTGVTGATAVAVGAEHACAIVAGGSVVCWGYGGDGELGVALPQGTSASYTPVTVPGVTGATAIAAGDYHTCVLLAGGTVTCWGENVDGEIGLPAGTASSGPVAVAGITGASAISAHDRASCALVAGTVRCWGTGYVVDRTLPPGVAAPGGDHPMVFETTKAVGLSSNDDFACVVLRGGAVQCTGFLPEMADGPAIETERNRNPVPGLAGVTAVAAGTEHVCVRSSDLTVRCWGMNNYGQLGSGVPVDDQAAYDPVVITLP